MENTILTFLQECDNQLFNKIVRTFATYKKLDFMSISQNDIIMLSPQKAFEYSGDEGDKYFKIWLAGSKIAFVTWANTMIDSQFRWNAKARNNDKRDNGDILGNEPYVSAYLKSNSAIEQCTMVYMFPFEKIPKFGAKKTVVIAPICTEPPKQQQEPKVIVKPPVEKKQNSDEKRVNRHATELERSARRINQLMGHLRDGIRTKSKKIGFRGIEEFYGNLCSEVNSIETTLIRIKSISPESPLIEHYEDKIAQWNLALEELEPQVKAVANYSILGQIASFFDKL
jgi:hypothetical protein